jgi:hypothetical protein
MKLNQIILVIALGAALSACVPKNDKPVTQRQKIEVTCLSVSTANKVILAAPAGMITKAQAGKYKQALDITDPVCDPVSGVYPTLTEAAYNLFVQKAAVVQETRAAVEK